MFLIFGDPVEHSKSPLMHNYFFKKNGINECYGRYRLKEGSEIITKFKELKIKGANVTVPHKEWAYRLADEVRGVAKKIGAVNTLVLEDGKIVGYNTDAPGFLEAIKEFEYKSVLIIGAGGTAKAISLVLPQAEVLNRSDKRLDYFKEKGIKAYTWETFEKKSYDLIINTTSAGLNDNSYPAKEELLKELFSKARYAVDVIYGKETPFLKLAKEYNLKTKSGLDMLVYQGVLAMELFLNRGLEREKTAELYFEILR